VECANLREGTGSDIDGCESSKLDDDVMLNGFR
jgi:hypothetical protein